MVKEAKFDQVMEVKYQGKDYILQDSKQVINLERKVLHLLNHTIMIQRLSNQAVEVIFKEVNQVYLLHSRELQLNH